MTKTKTKITYRSDVALGFCVYLIQKYISKTICDPLSWDLYGLFSFKIHSSNREHTHRSHDPTRSIRIYSDVVFAEFDGWNAVAYSTLTEHSGHIPADCVNPRMAKLLAQYAAAPGAPGKSQLISLG
jgi:hypothetical protein